MYISEEVESEIIENNEEISKLLKNNELIIKAEGFNPPSDNYAIAYNKRIHFPAGYIRTSQEFIQIYHLNNIVKDSNTKSNISYCLQLSDYYNYLFNRFYIWGSVETMFYKYDIINLMSIMESLIAEAIVNIYHICEQCKNINSCKLRANKGTQNNMRLSVKHLYEKKVLNLTADEIRRINELYDLRNRVHVRLAKNNEFLDRSFCQDTHNELIILLKKVTEQLNEYGVVKYDNCASFVIKRRNRKSE